VHIQRKQGISKILLPAKAALTVLLQVQIKIKEQLIFSFSRDYEKLAYICGSF